MRKFALIITIAALLLTSCVQTNEYDESPATALPSSPSPKAEETAGPEDAYDIIDTAGFNLPQTLSDDDYLSVELVSIAPVSSLNIEMVFEIQNQTQSSYLFEIQSFAINNFMMPEYNSSFEIAALESGTHTQKIHFDTLNSVYGIKKVVNISFDYSITDIETGTTLALATASLANGKAQNAQEIKNLKTDYLIASDEYVDIYFADAYYGDYGTECYEILIYNKSSENIAPSSMIVAINGITVDCAAPGIVSKNSYFLYKGSVLSDETSFLTGWEKAASAQIEVTYSISDVSDLSFIVSSETLMDETIQIEKEEFEGQVIYDEDGAFFGFENISEDTSSPRFLFYAENNSNETICITVPQIIVNGQEQDKALTIYVLPGTYALQSVSFENSFSENALTLSLDYEVSRLLSGDEANGILSCVWDDDYTP